MHLLHTSCHSTIAVVQYGHVDVSSLTRPCTLRTAAMPLLGKLTSPPPQSVSPASPTCSVVGLLSFTPFRATHSQSSLRGSPPPTVGSLLDYSLGFPPASTTVLLSTSSFPRSLFSSRPSPSTTAPVLRSLTPTSPCYRKATVSFDCLTPRVVSGIPRCWVSYRDTLRYSSLLTRSGTPILPWSIS